jgi:hypothetical protein
MNVANFIFRLLHIHNLLTLSVLTSLRSPYTPFASRAHLLVDCDNTSTDYIDFSVDCAHSSKDYANIHDDRTNIIANSSNTFDISSLNRYIPNPAQLQLLLIYKLKIKIVFTVGSVICFLSSSFFICGFYISHLSSSSFVLEFTF